MESPILVTATSDTTYLVNQLITYIGNKRRLLQFIGEALSSIQQRLNKDKLTILDGFAGSGVVSRFFKQHAKVLHSNDLERYAYIIGQCHLTNRDDCPPGIVDAVEYFNAHRLRDDLGVGIIEDMYAPKDDDNIQDGERAFYTNRNAKIIDNVRRMIDVGQTEVRPFVLASLIQKASVHANTSGVFKGFYKNSSTNTGQFGGNGREALSRIIKDIAIEVPMLSMHQCECHMYQRDINDLVKEMEEVDVAYFDPPYNQHPYGSNYFMLNLIADYIRPSVISMVSGIPVTWNKSNYNKKRAAVQSFDDLLAHTKAKFIMLSYNDEGILSIDELQSILKKYGHVTLQQRDYTTFRGSRNLCNRSKQVKEQLFVIEKAT